MRESCTYGSVRGAPSNGRPYRDRREFMSLLGGAAAAWPIPALGQQTRTVWRIGVLETISPELNAANFDALRKGLGNLGSSKAGI